MEFLIKNKLSLLLCMFVLVLQVSNGIAGKTDTLRISTFDVDATPPVGSYLAYDKMVNSWDLSLRARGVVISGAGLPVVLCSVDWIGIANDSQDAFKTALADAAGTVPDRVAVHTVHQHDAPVCDFGAEKFLRQAGNEPKSFDGAFARELISRLAVAVKSSLEKSRPFTQIGTGKAEVHEVASNRRIIGPDGKVKATRYSSTRDSALRAEPEGLIDPMVSLVSFWNGDQPVAVLSYYANHPMSYYRQGVANPDYPGIARFMRQLAVPQALHIHFNGAGGNLTAGKYNDGSRENRGIFAERLADGMRRAWESTKKETVTPDDFSWAFIPVSLPPASHLENLEADIKGKDMVYQTNNLSMLVWLKRMREGKKMNVSCLGIGSVRILHMPGELFVEYQLAAKKMRPDLFVTMAAYGDYGPGYICTAKAYQEGGYEAGDASGVRPEAEGILMDAVRKLLEK